MCGTLPCPVCVRSAHEMRHDGVVLLLTKRPAARVGWLAADFERDTGIPCRLSVEGKPVALPPEARLSLYRTAQEALTNVRKHAAATSVAIHLRYGRHETELAHGRLEAGPTSSGFRVRLWLPT